MKKLLALVFFLLLGSLSYVSAQPLQGRGSVMPGAQQIVIQYGEQLNLTDEQKSELIAQSLEQRSEVQRHRMRGDQHRSRDQQRMRLHRKPNDGDKKQKQSEDRTRLGNYMQRIYDVLTDEQSETLKSLLVDQAEKEHEYRILRNEIIVSRAGIEGEKAEQVATLLNRQSEARKDMSVQRIQNSGNTDREAIGETFQNMHEGHREIKNILTAAEYEKLQQVLLPRTHGHRTMIRRPALLKR